MSDQLEIFHIASPCIGVCTSGPNGYCIGCYRSRDERVYWNQLSDIQRKKVIKACRIRKLKVIKARLQAEEVAKVAAQASVPDPQISLF